MKVAIIGCGYVGLVTGTCLSEVGNYVSCYDIDDKKISDLKRLIIPIYEPGLEGLIQKNVNSKRLEFTNKISNAIQDADIIFIAVSTNANPDGSANVSNIFSALDLIAEHLEKPSIIVNKSTAPVGTTIMIEETLNDSLKKNNKDFKIIAVSNPEFLKEGVAVKDFMSPDRIIIGTNNKEALALLELLYAPFQRNHVKIISMDSSSAELSKYASNAMLATRISFMNELSVLAEKVNANIDQVRIGLGSDKRIGRDFLYAGCGYGGSCFPKDVDALIDLGNKHSIEMRIPMASRLINNEQKQILFKKISEYFDSDLKGKRFALWGLSFKPDTDDMREAPSIELINDLLSEGAIIQAYDPIVNEENCRFLEKNSNLQILEKSEDALKNADALIIVTEWREFLNPDFELIKMLLNKPIIFDGRNIYNNELMVENGFTYRSIGRPALN